MLKYTSTICSSSPCQEVTHHLPAQSSAWQSPRLSGEILHISNWSKLAAKSLQNIALYFALMVRFGCVTYFASHDLREPPLYLSCQPIRHPPLSVIVKVETHPLFFLVRQVWIHIFIERIIMQRCHLTSSGMKPHSLAPSFQVPRHSCLSPQGFLTWMIRFSMRFQTC